jgi:chemotaxis protein MotB
MRKQLTRTLLLVVAVAMTGCVAQGQADRYRTLYRKSQEQIVDLQAQLEEARSRIKALKQAENRSPEMERQLEELRQQRDRLQQALSDAKQQLQEARSGPELGPELDSALAELARNNPELTYNPDKGMVKFQTDITFDLGSAQVSDNVQGTIQDLASVLNSGAAQPYGVRIVGHTDNVPIRKPSTKEKHPTNWHLSVHRAIAIEEVLENAGVSPQRMGVAGYGPYRPIVENGPNGAKQNRRVELYLVKRSELAGSASASGSSSASSGSSGGRSGAQTKSGDGSGGENPAMYK